MKRNLVLLLILIGRVCSADYVFLPGTGGGGSGITELNGLNNSTQTFHVPGTAGTAPNWVSAGSTHTLNIPNASTSSVTLGGISKTAYDTFNAKLTAVLADGNILVGNVSNVATAVTPSGQATMDNTGAFTLANSAVIAKVLTGYSSGAGTVASTDSILQAIQKLNGNDALKVSTTLTSAKILVGNGSNIATAVDVSGDATIANTGAVTVANSAVIGKVLTGYSSGAGTVASTDTILQAVQKLNGNTAAKAGLDSPVFTTQVTLPNSGAGTDGGANLGTLDGTGTDTKRFKRAYFSQSGYAGDFGSKPPITDFDDHGFFAYSETAGHPPSLMASWAGGGGDLPILILRSSGGTAASPTTTLNNHLLGEIDFRGMGSTGNFLIGADIYAIAANNYGSSTAPTQLIFETNGTTRFKIDGSGNTVITNGTFEADHSVSFPGLASSSSATTGTLCWTTGGDVNVDTTVACLASTRKVKQDIEPLDSGLETVMKLRPVSYQRKAEFNPQHNGREVGLIAEDVQKVDSRLVAADDKGEVFGVRYMQYTAVLTRAIQQQQMEIQELRKEISTLKESR